MPSDRQTLVLGLGNLVHSDDGLGVHAIQIMQRDTRISPDVVLMDGGTQGLALLPHISAFERVILIDALDVGESPGTLVRLEGPALKNLPGKPSVHQLGFADLMIALELLGESPEQIVFFGIQPLSIDWGIELTTPVRVALENIPDLVIQQLRAWGKDCEGSGDSARATTSAAGPASGLGAAL
jgi:hydrogenase maturation protease